MLKENIKNIHNERDILRSKKSVNIIFLFYFYTKFNFLN